MWDWERASVPYRPIFRRRLLRRRVLTLLIAAIIAIPYYLYHQHVASEPLGQRVFDQVVSTISLRYFDRSYHGVAWRQVAEQHRSIIVNAPTTQAPPQTPPWDTSGNGMVAGKTYYFRYVQYTVGDQQGDLSHAVELTSGCPILDIGGFVEVRPVMLLG